MIILTIGLLLTMSTSLIVIIIGLCIICFGFFTAHSLTATLVSETAEHHKGTASSLYFIAYYTGVAIGSSILGPVYENINWIGFVLIFSLLPLIYFIFINIKAYLYIYFYLFILFFFISLLIFQAFVSEVLF